MKISLACDRLTNFRLDPTIDEQCKLINNTTSISWDFLDPSQYIYNEDHIEVTNGSATLKTVDQTHSGADLEDGTHVGTFYDSASKTIKLKSTEHPDQEVRSINALFKHISDKPH